MGNSMKKLSTVNGDTTTIINPKISEIVERNYEKIAKDTRDWGTSDIKMKKKNLADFYRAVCQTVEEINDELGGTTFRAPEVHALETAFKEHCGNGKNLTKDNFKNIMKGLVFKTGFSFAGAKDIVLNIFGVPVTALFIKNIVMPNAISDDIFIPAVTSATVYVLAKRHKL